MQNSKFYLWLIAIVVMTLQIEVKAQSNTINTFSSYSMYGLGELQSQGTLATRSMGSAGVAMRSISSINLINPASYSIALRRGILFDFSVEGSTYLAEQNINGTTQTGSYTTANFQSIALQIPITKGLGFGFSVTPYSDVGYRLLDNDIITELGYVEIENSGSGTITEVKFGLGWEIMSGLSLGFAAQYYWGNIDREFVAEITNMTSSGEVISMSGVDNISVSNIKGQFGLQAELANNSKRVITAGFTLDVGGDVNPRYVRAVSGLDRYEDIYAQSDTTKTSIVIPSQITLGVDYSTSKLQLLADINYQGWGGHNDAVELTQTGIEVAYNNVWTGRVGMQYIPRRGDVRHYYNRMSYRLGANYGGYQYTYQGEKMTQYAITAGLGFPIKVIGISKIDAGIEWGGMGKNKVITVDGEQLGLVKQNHFKFSLGFTLFGEDYWFQRPQID